MMSLTPSELNFLIFRYLSESGFSHTAFAFGYEAGISNSTIDGNIVVPPGALVTFIQKGIQYLGNEAKLNNGDLEADGSFQFLHPIDLITKDVNELQQIINDKKENIQKNDSKGKEKVNAESSQAHDNELAAEREEDFLIENENEKELTEKENERHRERTEIEKDIAKGKEKENPFDEISDANHKGDEINGRFEENGTDGGAQPMDVCTTIASSSTAIPNIDVTVFQGHTSEVFACAWHPTASLLASGSADTTARIWTVDQPSIPNMHNGPPIVVLRHSEEGTNDKINHVNILDWNVEGTLLATGSYDGQVRMWNRDGDFISALNEHSGPIFCLKWNKRGDYLLSGSGDSTAILWNVRTAELRQQLKFHSASILDVDWRSNTTFATCSRDSMIYVCRVGESRPMKTFAGHQGEVNEIKWDPTSTLLASCSEDSTAKIWALKQGTCLLNLTEHTREIYSIRWSPTGPGTNNPNHQLVLASASFDSTVKLWDIEAGRILHTLEHKDDAYSVAFSPNGEYLATGALDNYLHIWSVKEGKIVKSFQGGDGIFEVCWNSTGDKVAACFSNKVCVLDFRI